ncbi:MAG: DUF1939 domain-containing protein [Kiritimatiellia bacterium]|nr:DUF1939 domain-containing protein [Kiritimatiellia bacterium]MDP6809607.1 DUF1939 domain-containing protein [Kiritimatiellia bacterium]MDP7023542.1 DUF1939 domain-containing protein [Kiritimatiellia bacterium]
MKNRLVSTAIPLLLLILTILAPQAADAEVILQWFETDWDEIYQRLPELGEIGYDAIWTPSPCKSPVSGNHPNGGGGNVGYSLYDRWDLGQIPQRGTLRTRYGTMGSLQNMVRNLHQVDAKIYPDVVYNHYGNGPNFWTYPGMKPWDFHMWYQPDQPGSYRRADRMTSYDDINNGYGGTFKEELVSLIDIQTEPDKRFSGGSPGFAYPESWVRQPGQDEFYPFGAPSAEYPWEMLCRWIYWLGDAMDYDGLRLDAAKHVIHNFYGEPGEVPGPSSGGFLHQAQYSFDQRRSFAGTSGSEGGDEYSEMYTNDIRQRDDALFFAEIFAGDVNYFNYWRTGAGSGGNKMRYLDFPQKSSVIDAAFGGGDLTAIKNGSKLSATEGILFPQSHDQSAPWKLNLAYAYALTFPGIPIVYSTGNNLSQWEIDNVTWMKPGHEYALGDGYNGIKNLVYIHNQFARSLMEARLDWEGDVYVFERYEDVSGGTPGSIDYKEGILLVGLNDSGWNQTRNVSVSFENDTVLHDYTGNQPADVTVTGGKANITIPGMDGQGWVCYAPYNARGHATEASLAFLDPNDSNNAFGTMDWIVPGGELKDDKPRTLTRITGDSVNIDVKYQEPLGSPVETVNSVMVKWGQGFNLDTNAAAIDDTSQSIVSGGFEKATSQGAQHWRLTADVSGLPEGLHTVKARLFNGRTGKPALFQTFSEVVYVDRVGPSLDVTVPAAGETVPGGCMAVVSNPDFTAYNITYGVDGAPTTQQAHEVMKGTWRFALPLLSTGTHTVKVEAVEADYGDPRAVINTSYYERVFSVANSGTAIGLNHGEGSTLSLPFFTTAVTGVLGGASVRLFWDGYEMAGVAAAGGNTYEHTFDGRYLSGGTTQQLYGAFINGPHVFEAEVVAAGVTSKLARTVFFSLFGGGHVDSDGDGLPDDIEVNGFTSGWNPGPNGLLGGVDGDDGRDYNQDAIPNDNEEWIRLNPMNHDTDYDTTPDGEEDWDGDGKNNLCEVRQGYIEFGNPYHYDIYNGASTPSACTGDSVPARVEWDPPNPERCAGNKLTITYTPNQGPLNGHNPIHIGIETNGSVHTVTAMTDIGGGSWRYELDLQTTYTGVDFWFQDAGASAYDNNGGANYQVTVDPCVPVQTFFNMDGDFDSPHYDVANNGMKIVAAVRSNNLYVATWSANGSDTGSDHFLFVTDVYGSKGGAPWGKSGLIHFDKSSKPYLSAESAASGGFHTFNHSGVNGQYAMGANGEALEGELNLAEVFGAVPDVVYLAAFAYTDEDGGGLYDEQSQAPAAWSFNSDLEITEYLPVPIDSIRDDNGDGYYDCGRPTLLSVVGTNTNDANYNIRRFFLDELAGDSEEITFIFHPNTKPGDTVEDVELISNINRRDFATLEYDLDQATTSGASGYFRAYAMAPVGDTYQKMLTIKKTGAYRATVRYTVNGEVYYYTDNGLRRDLAVVVSPKKVLNRTMYELNPMIAEASGDELHERSTLADMYTTNAVDDVYIPAHYQAIGVNCIWLQPIHPIGKVGRQTDPDTASAYDPGSPFAIANFFEVNKLLGDPATRSQAMDELSAFVASMDQHGIDVMLDAPFNHSAWDCEISQVGVDMFPWATDPTNIIAKIRPEWYSSRTNYGERASYFNATNDTDIGEAPDRFDFGKWSDVADFNFGKYDTLVQGQSGRWHDQYLSERDVFEEHDTYSRELWRYWAEYVPYWLEKTGHPAGTPKSESYKGIDGLRCDFAQGMPAVFWEYIINKARSLKWDMYFMAESLDGYREVDGSKRHGLSFRSARHFDIMNENILFYWRDTFFGYPANGEGSGRQGSPETYPTWKAFDDRRKAYDNAPLLNALTTHDEVFPSDDPGGRLVYAYAEMAAMDGIPLLMYGMEAGALNSYDGYGFTGDILNTSNNWERYEANFGKVIPNFKRYNHMRNVWDNRDWDLQALYGRINRAKKDNPALQSQQNYFLSTFDGASYDPDIFAVARFIEPGVSAATQDVVFVLVDNDPSQGGAARKFSLDAEVSPGVNWFGIDPTHNYNFQDLIATNPSHFVWGSDVSGETLITNGLYAGFPYQDQYGHYLRLVDRTEHPSGGRYDHDSDGIADFSDPDDDNDGMSDVYENNNNLNATNANTPFGWDDDKDGDTIPNGEEMIAGTDPDDITDYLRITGVATNSGGAEVSWRSVAEINYLVEHKGSLLDSEGWMGDVSLTATDSNQTADVLLPSPFSNRFWRVQVIQ